MPGRSVDREVDKLYGLSPEEFTAARDRLAKELKAAGDQSGATAVKALRRPTVAAWAVNQVVRRDPKGADALLEVGDELRKAQRRALSGVSGGGGLREATDRRRKAVRNLLKGAEAILHEAGRSSAGAVEAVQATLDAASTDETAGRLVREGRLAKELPPPSGFGDVEGLALVPTPQPEPAPRPAERTKAKRKQAKAGGQDAARLTELRAERDDARTEARARQGEAERARKEAHRTSQAAVKAQEEAERARDAAERSRQRARGLAAEAREAGVEADRTKREADRAERALHQVEERLAGRS